MGGDPFLCLFSSQVLPACKAFLRNPVGGSASYLLPSLFLPFENNQSPPFSLPFCPCLLHQSQPSSPLGLAAHLLGAWVWLHCARPGRSGPCASLWFSGVSLLAWRDVLGVGTGMMMVTEGSWWPGWRAVWWHGGVGIQGSLLSLDLGQGSELIWASYILIWRKEAGTVSEFLAVLFITMLRGPREEGVASLVCPSVLGLSVFPRALPPVSVGRGRAHTALGKCTAAPLLTVG